MNTRPNVWNDRLLRKLILQTIGGMAVLFALVMTLAALMRESLTAFAQNLIETLGYFGIFLSTLVSDALIFPIPPSSYIFFAVAAQSPIIPVLIASSLGSLIGGSIAYFIGPYLQKIPFFSRRIEAFRTQGEELFRRWGAWTIMIAAVTPLPFSVICWFAGIYKMRYRRFFTAALVRVPRLFVYYGVYLLGWSPSMAG